MREKKSQMRENVPVRFEKSEIKGLNSSGNTKNLNAPRNDNFCHRRK